MKPTTSPARARLEAAIEAKSSAALLAAHAAIEAQADKGAAERLTAAVIADCLTARHGLDEALELIFADEEFTGTYHDALLEALAATGAEV